LGVQFGDPSLNARFEPKEGADPEPLFQFSLNAGVTNLTCRACGVTVIGKRNLDVHLQGKRHKATMASVKTLEPAPPGEEDSLVPSEASIQRLLDDYKEAPLIGIEYLVEILSLDNAPPSYKCLLCDTNLDVNSVISCLTSSTHRLKYLKRYYPTAGKKFAEVPNLASWRSETLDYLESVVLRIENKNGRLNPTVVGSYKDFIAKTKAIKNSIECGKHFRQTPEQDFSSLPDPFAGYRDKLRSEDLVVNREKSGFDKNSVITDPNDQIHIGGDIGLDHIEDPQMQSLMQREIARFALGGGPNDPPPSP